MKRWSKGWFVAVLLLFGVVLLAMPHTAQAAERITDPRELCKTWHTVVRGEDLTQIAAKYNTNVLFLVYLNQVPDPNLIYPGQELCVALKVRAGRLYMVSSGETLTGIAAKYNSDVAYLVEVNNLFDQNYLFVGQVLYIPKGRILQVAR